MSQDHSRDTRGPSKAVRTNAVALEKAARAWHMRVIGMAWADIAREVGYGNPSNVRRAVKSFLGRLPEVDAAELKTLWRARLELLWGHTVLDARAGKSHAIRSGVAVAARAAELDGLDAPKRSQVQVGGGDELERLLTEIAALTGLSVPMEGDPFAVIDAEVVDDDEDGDDDAA